MEECEGTLQVTLPDFESLFWDTIFSFSPLWPVLRKVELDDFEDGGMSGESAGDSCGVMRHHFGIQFSHFHPFGRFSQKLSWMILPMSECHGSRGTLAGS